MITIFYVLVFFHCLADYPLQGDFLSKAKNHKNPISGVPWYQALGAHAIIHGGFVGIITGSTLLGLMETAAHWHIDYRKNAGELTYNQDQALHILCKLVWVTFLTMYYALENRGIL